MERSEPIPTPAAPPPSAFLLRLSRLLLSKAERSQAPGPVRLSLDRKVAPELHDAIDADQVQLMCMQIDDLCVTGWVSLRLDQPRAFASFVERKPRLELCDFDALSEWAGYTPQARRWQRQWLAHLAAHWQAFPDNAPADYLIVLEHLARSPLAMLEGLSLNEATQSIVTLTALCRSRRWMPLREASAQAFQGRSKVLDHRDELLRLLGASTGQFVESPIQLLVDVPRRISTEVNSDDQTPFADVLFIENLATFEHMADDRRSGWESSLLVYAAGFRGSAKRLRSRGGCRLYLRAPGPADFLPAIESWLFGHPGDRSQTALDVPVHFFGDLDHAGMLILASLREVFVNATAWRIGYQHLAALLAAGHGHPPELANKAQQIDPGDTGCAYADEKLLPLIRRMGSFIDQEAFSPGDVPGRDAAGQAEALATHV